ncbi:MAG: hypothetical protein ACXWYS_02675 [Gaiellaceae bacterium]
MQTFDAQATLVDPSGMRDGRLRRLGPTTVSDLAPAAAAVGGAIALVILGASFGLGDDRRRPALT